MAIKHFLGGRIILGTEYAGYKYRIFEAGTSTPKTTYKDSALTVGNENADPVVLDANGACQIWFEGNAKSIFYTGEDVVVYTDDNVNVAASSTATGNANLILNGSFEDDTDADSIPDNWTRTLYTGGSFTHDSTDQLDGSYSAKFTSTGTGGGYITSTANFSVSPNTNYTVGFAIKSSVADVRNVVEILWYQDDGTASATASTTVYDDSTTNPTSWTKKWSEAISPSDAAFAKIRLTGSHSSDVTAGSTWFDDVIFSSFAYKAAMNTFDQGIGPGYIQNVGMIESVSTNALTIALKGKNGVDPSLTNVVSWACRPNSLGSGGTATYQIVQGTAAKSITIPAGASLGFSNSENGYIYRYLSYDGTTSQLAVTKLAIFDEALLHSVTAISTTGTSSVALYGGTAQSNAALRMIGRGKIAASGTAGNWTVVSTRLDMWHPSMKRTGDIVSRWSTVFGTAATGTSVIPQDNSVPNSTEGDEYLSLSVLGSDTSNKFRIYASMLAAASAGNSVMAALFRNAESDALRAVSHGVSANNVTQHVMLRHEEKVPATGTTTYKIRAGCTQAGTITINGNTGTQILGGVGQTELLIEEIQE